MIIVVVEVVVMMEIIRQDRQKVEEDPSGRGNDFHDQVRLTSESHSDQRRLGW